MRKSLSGARYRSRSEVPVRVWSCGAVEALLPSGETVEVEAMPPRADWRFARPQRYHELEPSLVPMEDLKSPRYSGYSLVIECARLDTDFDVVPGEPGQHPVSDILDHGRRVFTESVDDLVRQLASLIPRYELWGIVDWQHPPGNDDLEGLLRYEINVLTAGDASNRRL